MALHAGRGCTVRNSGFSGSLSTSNCYVYAPGQPMNAGCSIHSLSPDSYGTGFNKVGGGVYAAEWTNEAISVWFFPRPAIPEDISSGHPDPATWGVPTAKFAGNCDLGSHIGPQRIACRPLPRSLSFHIILNLYVQNEHN